MKRKKTLSDLTTQLQESPVFAAPEAETLVQQAAATEAPEPRSHKPVRAHSKWQWLLASLLLLLVSGAAPLLLLLSVATVAVPLLVLLTIVALACWKVADWTYGKLNRKLGDPQ